MMFLRCLSFVYNLAWASLNFLDFFLGWCLSPNLENVWPSSSLFFSELLVPSGFPMTCLWELILSHMPLRCSLLLLIHLFLSHFSEWISSINQTPGSVTLYSVISNLLLGLPREAFLFLHITLNWSCGYLWRSDLTIICHHQTLH